MRIRKYKKHKGISERHACGHTKMICTGATQNDMRLRIPKRYPHARQKWHAYKCVHYNDMRTPVLKQDARVQVKLRYARVCQNFMR